MLVLTAATVALGPWHGSGSRLFPLWAILGAAIQLSTVALLLGGGLAVPWTAAAFVLLMLSTASATAMGAPANCVWAREAAAIGVAAGALVTLGARSSRCSSRTRRRAIWWRESASSSATR
jgi:putative ABC transport system permease protein